MSKKLRIGVIFGGRSGEHEVSLRSAESIINALDKKKYEVVPIGITPTGKWLTAGDSQRLLKPKDVVESGTVGLAMLGDPTRSPLVRTNGSAPDGELKAVDVFFPVLHGTYGEDGTIQGLFEMADIPYVGCGVAASACGMDKILMKNLFRQAGLTTTDFVWFTRLAWENDPKKIVNSVVKSIGFPAFVKPANLGSSVGISKAHDRTELKAAIDKAARYDRKILVEKGVEAREIEVSVLGNESPVASLPGEIVAGEEFYDYKDKYLNNKAALVIPAKVSAKLVKEFQKTAVQAFQAVDGAGLARVDFFLEKGTDRIIVNELNTMPGFTSISMYPKLWEASGLSYGDLLTRLIELAVERHREKSRSTTSYEENDER